MLAILLAASLASPGPPASPAPILRHMVFSAHIDATGGMSTAYRGANAGETGVPRSVLVAGHSDAVGDSWNLQYGPDNSGQLHVSVSKNDGSHVVLALKGTAFETNPETRRQQLSGTVTYDPAHTIPVSANVAESVSVENGNGTENMQYNAQFTLKSDSMGGS